MGFAEMIDFTKLPVNLTLDELRDLTNKTRPASIVKSLGQMHIPYLLREDGYPVVSRIAYETVAAGETRITMARPKLKLEHI